MKKIMIALGLITTLALPAVAENNVTLTLTSLYDRIEALQKENKAQQRQIAELQRKVNGVQKQITILHTIAAKAIK